MIEKQKSAAGDPAKITFLQYRAILKSNIWADGLAAELKLNKAAQSTTVNTKAEWDALLEKLKNRPAGKKGPASYVPAHMKVAALRRGRGR